MTCYQAKRVLSLGYQHSVLAPNEEFRLNCYDRVTTLQCGDFLHASSHQPGLFKR